MPVHRGIRAAHCRLDAAYAVDVFNGSDASQARKAALRKPSVLRVRDARRIVGLTPHFRKQLKIKL